MKLAPNSLVKKKGTRAEGDASPSGLDEMQRVRSGVRADPRPAAAEHARHQHKFTTKMKLPQFARPSVAKNARHLRLWNQHADTAKSWFIILRFRRHISRIA